MFCLSTFRFLIVKNSGDHVSKSSEKVCTQDDSLGSMNRNVGIDNNVLYQLHVGADEFLEKRSASKRSLR